MSSVEAHAPGPLRIASRAVRRFAPPLLVLLLAGACRRSESADERWENDDVAVSESWTPEGVDEVLAVPVDTVAHVIARRLEDGARPAGIRERDWRRVQTLYAAFDGVPLWFDEGGIRERTAALVNALAHAPTDGLRLSNYPVAAIRRALASVRESREPSVEALAEADVLLTSAVAALAEDMLAGPVDPRSVSQGWHVDVQEADVDSALARTLRTEPLDRGIARMRPQAEDFDGLREALKRYTAIVANGGWPRVPEGSVLEPGDTSTVERLQALVERMRIEGYAGQVGVQALPDSVAGGDAGTRAVYDAALAGAVARFQARHSIAVDSVLGPGTLASLNTSAEYRLRQVVANIERYRWLPRTLGSRYVFVNVPAFSLRAYDDGKPVLQMKVIVGSEYNDQATPAFSDSIAYAVFRPYWNIPKNIALEEILPKAQRDPGYMRRGRYEVVRGWREDAPALGQYVPSAAAIASGALRIRQQPGGDNSLGLVKFIFPNDFAIYLHDTPAPELFERDVRAFSHGCIRLERPDELARYLLGWEPERIREAMTSGPGSRRVDLERKVPVYILYLTAYLQGGELHFGNDLYDRDDVLTRAVAEAAAPPPELVAELQALARLVE